MLQPKVGWLFWMPKVKAFLKTTTKPQSGIASQSGHHLSRLPHWRRIGREGQTCRSGRYHGPIDPHCPRAPTFMRCYLRNLAWHWLLGLAREHDGEIAAIVRLRVGHELLMEPDHRANPAIAARITKSLVKDDR